MTRQLQERLSLVGTVVAILAFGITYGKTVDPVTAIGVVGLSYIVLTPLAFWALKEEGELKLPPIMRESWMISLAALTGFWVLVALSMSSVDWNFQTWPLLVLGGFALLVGPPSLLGLAIVRYQERHKRCPECGNDVLSVARICQHCGYRWQPPLPSPASFPD